MAKQGIRISDLQPIFKVAEDGPGWSLCVGAGTSIGVFPDWHELVRRLVGRDSASPGLADRLLQSYSPDALIEAATRRLRVGDLSQVLADVLYSDLKRRAGPAWPSVVSCLEAKALGNLAADRWGAFLTLFETHAELSHCSALQVGRVVARALNSPRAPASIISFNAEPLLFALINGFAGRRSDRGYTGTRQPLDRITRSTSFRASDRLPYFFCHGLLPVLDGASTHVDSSSPDKLVFSESQYLALGNAVTSWQATTFLDTAMTRPMLFVGVSLSDSNMRAWLSRVATNRRRELKEVHGHDGEAAFHYWIHRYPGDDAEAKWIEDAVSHLGVRVVWIDQWSQVQQAMERALGLSPEDAVQQAVAADGASRRR